MKRIQKVLEIEYDALTKKDWDNVLIVVGDEGTGKSTLLLHILEYWCILRYGVVKPEHIKFMNLDLIKWAESLSECQKAEMNILDESGDLSGRRTTSNLNVAVNRAYQIIRGDNINSILALPDLFWLDGFFTKRRARGLIYVYARGRLAYWNRERLRRIVDLNANRVLKSLWVVNPLFYDSFPKYKGILLDAYKELKADYMKDTRKELAETIKKIKGKESESTNPINDKIKSMLDDGLSIPKIAEQIGLSRSAIGLRVAKIKGEQLARGDVT